MIVDAAQDEQDDRLGWKKRSDSFILSRLKVEAFPYASRGIDIDVIAEMVGRRARTVRDWLSGWRLIRLHSVATGHASKKRRQTHLTHDTLVGFR